MKKAVKNTLIVLSCIFAFAAAAAAYVAYIYYTDRVKPGFERRYTLYVYPDMTAPQILDSLAAGAGAVNFRSLSRCAEAEELASRIKPGKYVIEPSSPAIYAVRCICNGWQSPHNLVLSGTIRKKDAIARKISSQMMVDSLSVMNALQDASFLEKYGFTPENVFAMVLPDTYEMYWTSSVEEIFDRLNKEYKAFWTPEREDKAKQQGLTRMQVSIVASIVSGETLKEFEYPIIAGVYLNRYRIGMKLQADPTVCFCYDYTLDRVLRKHLEIDSPYNTYKYAGLPPAPICSPNKACLDAVLNPDSHKYIYFCASPAFDGTHRFAVSYSEHLRNAREFQRELTIRRRAKKS